MSSQGEPIQSIIELVVYLTSLDADVVNLRLLSIGGTIMVS